MQPLSEHNQAAEQGGESPWAFWRSVAITLVVALGIRQYLVEARYIPSGSMLPGLQIQDRLLLDSTGSKWWGEWNTTISPRRGARRR